jgi:hypothetical protein
VSTKVVTRSEALGGMSGYINAFVDDEEFLFLELCSYGSPRVLSSMMIRGGALEGCKDTSLPVLPWITGKPLALGMCHSESHFCFIFFFPEKPPSLSASMSHVSASFHLQGSLKATIGLPLHSYKVTGDLHWRRISYSFLLFAPSSFPISPPSFSLRCLNIHISISDVFTSPSVPI